MSRIYKINEVAKLMNVSSELLRHYERLGLIEPKRNDNGYRYYNENDIKLLTGLLRFKKMNFSLTEIQKLLYEYNFQESYDSYLTVYERNKQDLLKQQLSLNSMEYVISQLDLIRTNQLELKRLEHEAIYRISLSLESVDDALKQLIDHLPISFISPMFSFNHESKQFEPPIFGYAIKESDSNKLNLCKFDAYTYIPKHIYMSCIVSTHIDKQLSLNDIDKILITINEMGYSVNESIWGYTLGNHIDIRHEHVRYHRLYFPINS